MNSPPRPTVLCVDDEDSNLTLRKLLFEAEGLEFLDVRSGEEALKLFCSREIAGVVLDCWMSGMKGTEIAAGMKRQRPKVRIIVLSDSACCPENRQW